MENNKFIQWWEKKMEKGRTWFLLKTFLIFFVNFLLIDFVLNKFLFGDPTLFNLINIGNWNKVVKILSIMVGGSLIVSYLQYWSLNKKYEKLKSGN